MSVNRSYGSRERRPVASRPNDSPIPNAYPPRCAAVATPLSEPRLRSATSLKIENPMIHGAGIITGMITKKNRNALMRVLGNRIRYAPVTAAIEPLAPITGALSTSM